MNIKPTLGYPAHWRESDAAPAAPPASLPTAFGASGAARSSASPFAINGRFLTQNVTGVQRYAREITRAMDALLEEDAGAIRVLTPGSAGLTPEIEHIKVERSSVGSGHAWEQLVLPNLTSHPLLNLCNLAPAIRKRQAICIHDANAFNAPDSYSTAFRTLYQNLLPLIARRSMAVTSVSNASADDLARCLSISRNAISVLPNGHEHALRWDARRSARYSGMEFGRPFILVLGSRAPHKNIGLMLAIAPQLDALGIDIVMAGGGGAIFAKTQEAESANVRRIGYVSDDDLAALMERAVCLAFPSLTEGFGLPIVEAMARSCPVVSSDRASMPEVCGTAALLAPPDKPEIWMRHFRNLTASEDLRAQCIERGRERVKAFSWTRSAQGYLDLMSRSFS